MGGMRRRRVNHNESKETMILNAKNFLTLRYETNAIITINMNTERMNLLLNAKKYIE